jgi:hypothetical protein
MLLLVVMWVLEAARKVRTSRPTLDARDTILWMTPSAEWRWWGAEVTLVVDGTSAFR